MDYAVNTADENIVTKTWAKYFPYWPLFLLLFALAGAAGWLYLKNKLPVYEASSSLLIKDERKGTEDSKVVENLSPLNSKKIIENEIEIIKSRSLMSKVVKQLSLYAPVMEERKWKNVPAYASSPVRIEVQNPDSLSTANKVPFSFNKANNTVALEGKSVTLGQWVETKWGALRFWPNNKNYEPAGQLYFSLIDPLQITEELIGALNVAPVSKSSSVILLKLTGEVPKRSKDILNGVMDAYGQASIDDKNRLTNNTISFLDERLKVVSHDLDSIEKRRQEYRSSRGAIDISSQGQLVLQNVSDNDRKLSDVNIKLTVLDQVEQYVNNNDGISTLAPSTLGINDPILLGLLNKLYDAELQYQKLKRTTGENNVILETLADEIQKIRPSIIDNIKSQREGLLANKNSLSRATSAYNAMLQSLPQQERDLVEISREHNIKSNIYSFLLQQREETALSHSAIDTDSRIVDKAVSSINPVGPGKKLVYAIAMFLALGIGILFISAREVFSRTILYRQEIQAATTFPIIGEILQEKKSASPLVIDEGRKGFIAEEFRMLRTSLHHLGVGSKGKKILVTSTIPGEGKSFVAANLAMSLAISGKKVVLVEFDLNNPTLAGKFNVQEDGLGVADYLNKQVDQVDKITRRLEAYSNLCLITSGTLPNNPSELILRHRTETLLEELGNRFDFVVIDSAPVGLLSDGYVLSRYCDATLFVVRHGYTPKKVIYQLEENNQINELKNLALIFNGVRTRGFGTRYSYGYGYGYVYGKKSKLRKIAG